MIDLENEFWNIRRKKLEKEFAKAALALMEHTGAGAMVLPIANTTPKTFIAIGDANAICGMLLNEKAAVSAVESAVKEMPNASQPT
jgi:hypothetical protein